MSLFKRERLNNVALVLERAKFSRELQSRVPSHGDLSEPLTRTDEAAARQFAPLPFLLSIAVYALYDTVHGDMSEEKFQDALLSRPG